MALLLQPNSAYEPVWYWGRWGHAAETRARVAAQIRCSSRSRQGAFCTSQSTVPTFGRTPDCSPRQGSCSRSCSTCSTLAPVDSSLRVVSISNPGHVVTQAPPPPAGSRGLEKATHAVVHRPPRRDPWSEARSVCLRQGVSCGPGSLAGKGLRGRSLTVCPQWFPDAGPGRHH